MKKIEVYVSNVEYKDEYQVLNEDLEILFKQSKDSYTNKSFVAFTLPLS